MAGIHTSNLPQLLSTFVGREREIGEVTQWLADSRLVTLTGAGGCGKTRLALQTATRLPPEFADGVWLIDLARLADPELVVQVAATVLGVREQPARPLLATLVDHLRRRESLLLLDNCEHLVAACAQLVTALLQACPDLRVLATSREPLGVTGEVTWVVPPLSLPAPQPWHAPGSGEAALSAYRQAEAVQLFVARATAVSPAFSLSVENGAWVAEICRRLDGLPLAIELAAARVRALSVREIAARLDDRFRLLTAGSRTALPRHQTLEATLDWSYKLLAEPEQQVLQRLAVFAGGCTLAAAEFVCSDAAVAADEMLDVLARLLDKSLVAADQNGGATRYRLLETIRQYARAKLLASGDAELVWARHCAYFSGWAEDAAAHLDGTDQLAWLARYEAEHDNLRAALRWCSADESRAAEGLRLAAVCGRFWRLHAYLSEGSAHLAGMLAHPGAPAQAPVRGWALSHLANLLYLRSDYPAMRPVVEQAAAIWRDFGEAGRAGLAFTLDLLGELETEEGSYERAPAFFQEALDLYTELGDMRGIGEMRMQFGWAAMRTGEYDEAAQHLAAFLAVARQTEDIRNTAFGLSGLGEVALRQGNLERAAELLAESLELNRARGDKWSAATVLGSLGWLAFLQHDYARMRSVLAESLLLRMAIGDQGGTAWCLEKLAEAILTAALAQNDAASAAVRRERFATAAHVFAAAAGVRAPINSVIDPADEPDYWHNLAVLHAELGEAAFAAAWAEGEAMALEAAVDSALAEPAQDPDLGVPQASVRAAAPQLGGLTQRELEATLLIAQGKTNREIAQAMTVSLKTVETYITRILNKLGLDSRVQVAIWALQHGLAGAPGSADRADS